MKVESQHVEINADIVIVYVFLQNMNNIGKLMPEQVRNWQSTEQEASFTIDNLGGFDLIYGENIPFEKINLRSTEKSKIKFDLDGSIKAISESQCQVNFSFSSDLNPFIASMVQKPLKHLVEKMIQQLQKQFQE